MAERRMFAKTIVTSDAFLDMPHSSRCLYFTLAMFADDDGFVNNPKSIMRQAGATPDDMNVLLAKKFVIAFDNGVIVIKHWRIHNYIRGDRKHETKYAEEIALLELDENGAYTMASSVGTDYLLESSEEATPRQKAYADSELPYSFDYKIRKAFWGKQCPICGALMKTEIDDGIVTKNHIPTIQHNLPISKGGRHELGNISVICHSCNVSIKDNETEALNAEEVIKAWEKICQTSDRQLTGKCHTEVRLGKDSIGKSSCIDLLEVLTNEEIARLKELYQDHYQLIDECQADANRKGKVIEKPFSYIVGYAENKGWLTK